MSNDYDIYPFPNVGNNPFYQEFHVGNMLPIVGSTSGLDTPLAKKDIIQVISKTNKEVEDDESEEIENMTSIVDEMFESFFGFESTEGGNPDIPDKIEPIINEIESKGYKVKYSSPGYSNTRFSNDRDKNGVINAKMVTTGRVIFSRDYKFTTTPKGWEWKVLKNGSKALYVKPYTYNEKMGTEKEAFQKWQKVYMDSLKEWAVKLPQCGTSDDTEHEPDENFK